MAIYLAVCMIWLKIYIAFASVLKNESCIDGVTIVLSFGLYQNSCPEAEPIIFSWVEKAVSDDPRMAASLLRLHFHDCFVNGCDASVLLDDTANFVGEKTAAPNLNSLRGFEVIDAIKADLEYACPQIVSCADILAVAARDSVVLSGGPGWEVQLGRKDSLSASKTAANNNIPGPNSDVPTLVSKFQNVGLSLEDMVALSGAHTMGKARCSTFSSRINGNNDPNSPDINLEFLQSLQQLCSQSNSNTTLADLDHMTPSMFDNQYYINILSGEGLLASDQGLATGNDRTREIIQTYVDDPSAFYEDFKNSMLKMGSLVSVSSGGEIHRNCRVVN
ncbi:peroxidase 40 [Olea europaea var. sylvestris]|uniref:Peroxidase n=1 Tax=Olea europaea subsp. europaea TaxID=158383 RepID=A0A8S0UGT7_OLEEU|nr:peroxidase 40 [Olea europaea var. sylvestris]CAA3016613.1 peroxidase 40 [Olea europaea subsp. europaea]